MCVILEVRIWPYGSSLSWHLRCTTTKNILLNGSMYVTSSRLNRCGLIINLRNKKKKKTNKRVLKLEQRVLKMYNGAYPLIVQSREYSSSSCSTYQHFRLKSNATIETAIKTWNKCKSSCNSFAFLIFLHLSVPKMLRKVFDKISIDCCKSTIP